MEKYTSALLVKLYAELQELTDCENDLQRFERSYYIAEGKMKELKEFMQSYTFKDKQEEVRFFKEVKPLFHKEVIYFNELFNIESGKPIATEEAKKQYYEKELDRIMVFFDKHRELYNYHRSGKVGMDNLYFLRNEHSNTLRPLYSLDLDSNFSTPYSLMLANIQAYEQLCSYINTVFYMDRTYVDDSKQTKSHSTWSSSKAALIELAIALYFSGSVNFGKGGFKKFITELEFFFDIQLGNVYRVFLSMIIRKKDPSPFLHMLVDTFQRKLEEKTM